MNKRASADATAQVNLIESRWLIPRVSSCRMWLLSSTKMFYRFQWWLSQPLLGNDLIKNENKFLPQNKQKTTNLNRNFLCFDSLVYEKFTKQQMLNCLKTTNEKREKIHPEHSNDKMLWDKDNKSKQEALRQQQNCYWTFLTKVKCDWNSELRRYITRWWIKVFHQSMISFRSCYGWRRILI